MNAVLSMSLIMLICITNNRSVIRTTAFSTNARAAAANSNIFTSLENPTIAFSNHHLLVVNKPPGWHSVPNEGANNSVSSGSNSKCLLQYLKRHELGGGSNKDFLLPMHRIDQPCSGVILFAKNSKAATRITTAWKKGLVKKEYWCVVEGNIAQMKKRSIKEDDTSYQVSGILTRVDSSRSVVVRPSTSKTIGRLCQIQWKHLQTIHTSTKTMELISVKTSSGARHQVRAMLSHLLKSPVVGDLRYGFGSSSIPLPDQSVALHARSLFLPSVQLGNTTDILQKTPFISPIPSTWADYFGLQEDDVKNKE